MISFGAYAAQLRAAAASAPALIEATLDAEMKKLAEIARGWPGRYHPGWPPLTAATMEDRERHGYAPNQPLLREGELRDGIIGGAEGLVGYLGNTVHHAIFHEIGWSGGPPRPIYSSVLTENLPQLELAFNDLARRLLT